MGGTAVTVAVDDADESRPTSPLKMATVTDAYYRWTDIVWHWYQLLPMYQRNAVSSVTHPNALNDPEHPLWDAAKGGIEVYIGTLSDGAKVLCFTLKQVQYLQYYLHAMRLADPAYLDYLAAVKIFPRVVAPPIDPEVEYVPLPGSIIPASSFTSVETVVMNPDNSGKAMHTRIKKHNKALERQRRTMRPCAVVPEPEAKVKHSTPSTWDEGEQQGVHVTTDYETASQPAEPDVEVVVTDKTREQVMDELNGDGRGVLGKAVDDAVASAREAMEDGVLTNETRDEINERLDKAAREILNKAADDEEAAEAEAARPDPENYFKYAQQALLLAGAGGLVKALRQTPGNVTASPSGRGTDTPATPGDETPGDAEAESDSDSDEDRAQIGRSLFLALDLRTGIANDLIDVGYAAVWFPDSIDQPGNVEMARDFGHWVVQGGTGATTTFAYGPSLPYARDRINGALKHKVFDLWKRAGAGPIYILVHSPDCEYTRFTALGMDVASYRTDLHVDEGACPSYADPASCGRRFVMDTARIFAAVEDGLLGSRVQDGTTSRTLADVMDICGVGGDDAQHNANAGNAAAFTMELFWRLLANTTIDGLRDEYGIRISGLAFLEAAKAYDARATDEKASEKASEKEDESQKSARNGAGHHDGDTAPTPHANGATTKVDTATEAATSAVTNADQDEDEDDGPSDPDYDSDYDSDFADIGDIVVPNADGDLVAWKEETKS